MKKLIIALVLILSMNSCVAQENVFAEIAAVEDTAVFSRMIVGDMVDDEAALYTKHYRKKYLVERKDDFVAGKEYFFRLRVHQDGTDVRRARIIWYHITPEQVEDDIKDTIKKYKE